MSENLNGLFNETDKDAANGGVRSLAGTAQLTQLSSEIASAILGTIENDLDQYRELLGESQVSHAATDVLINRAYDMTAIDVDFLKELDEETLEGMLKSQQSKRSRAKSKIMTLDNYRKMLTGAIAENILRLAMGKKKGRGGPRKTCMVTFTAEDLEQLKFDQDELRRELRNIQSRKSIYKAKEDFDAESPAWQALLVAESQLKEIRVAQPPQASVKMVIKDLLTGKDIQSMKAPETKQLLEEIAALIVKPTESEPEQEVN